MKIERIRSITFHSAQKTYDITNNETDCWLQEPNFFANDVLVHNCSVHAGGVCITDKPIYEYIPVERTKGEVITAYPESGASQILDANHIIKIDLLSIEILDVMQNAIDMIDEPLYHIIDDDGIEKIVPQSYLKE